MAFEKFTGALDPTPASSPSPAPTFAPFTGKFEPLVSANAKALMDTPVDPETGMPLEEMTNPTTAKATNKTGLNIPLAGEQFKSGVAGMQQGFYGSAARNNAKLLNDFDLMDKGQKFSIDRDPLGYQDMTPEQKAKVRDSLQAAKSLDVAKTIKYGAEQQGYLRHPFADQVVGLADKGEFSKAWQLFTKDPTGVLQQLSVESSPNALPALVGGAVGVVLKGGTAALMAGLASGSFPIEFNASIIDSLRDAKVDLNDAKAIDAKLRDPAFVEAAGKRALSRGVIIAAADGATGALLSPLKAGQLGKNVLRSVGNVGVETGAQMLGEAGAQVASGEKLQAGQILAEGLGAGPQTVATTTLKTIQESQKPKGFEPLPAGAKLDQEVPGANVSPVEKASVVETPVVSKTVLDKAYKSFSNLPGMDVNGVDPTDLSIMAARVQDKLNLIKAGEETLTKGQENRLNNWLNKYEESAKPAPVNLEPLPANATVDPLPISKAEVQQVKAPSVGEEDAAAQDRAAMLAELGISDADISGTPSPGITPAAPVVAEAPNVEPVTAQEVVTEQQELAPRKLTAKEVIARGDKLAEEMKTMSREGLDSFQNEALDIADELDRISEGRKTMSNGIRAAVFRPSKAMDQKTIDFYRNALEEERRKVGAGEEKFNEKLSMDDYYQGVGEKVVKRLENAKTVYSERIRAAIDQSNEYIQKLTDNINELGYSAKTTPNDAPSNVKELKSLIQGIAGSTSRLINKSEAIDKNYKRANPEQYDETSAQLQKDYAKADELINQGNPETPLFSIENPADAGVDLSTSPQALANEAILKENRDNMIADLARLKIKYAANNRRRAKGKEKAMDQSDAAQLLSMIDDLKDAIKYSYEPNTSPEAFLARAAGSMRDGEINREVYDFINDVVKNHPRLINGLRLQVRENKSALGGIKTGVAGQFHPISKVIRLFKHTSGMTNATTIRHELTHSLELMMPKDVREQLVGAWKDAIKSLIKRDDTKGGKEFIAALNKFLASPNEDGNYDKLIMSMPDMSYYQYVSPSEYWAVNAEGILKDHLGGSWQRFKKNIKLLFEGLKKFFGMDNNYVVYKMFNQIIDGERLHSNTLNDLSGAFVPLNSIHRNYKGDAAPLTTWASPTESKLDSFIYYMQDKHVDTKRVIQAITKNIGEISDQFNAYMKEELFHGRTAKRTIDFVRHDLLPIIQELRDNNLGIEQFDEFLQMRHAEERNQKVAEINEMMPDGGSGVTTEQANNYLANLDPAVKSVFEGLAYRIDKIIKGTQDILVENGLEEQSTIDSWNNSYKHYVPLMREDLDFAQRSTGQGSGYATRGSSSKRAIGSNKNVIDVFGNIALQRERAIIRAEKARVGRALYSLSLMSPNPDFWLPVNPDAVKNKKKLIAELQSMGVDPVLAENIISEPKTSYIDSQTGLVAYRVNEYLRNSDNVFPVRINGKDRFIFFNPNDERAMRMVSALKNLDADQLGSVLSMVGQATRWISSVNTQYNPVFGLWNFSRDLGGAQFNLSTTKIAGKQAQVTANVFPALFGIYRDLRRERAGKESSDNEWAALWEDFQKEGGQTGYRDQFSKDREKKNIIERELAKMDRKVPRKAMDAVFGWLSDYNDAMENAVRLSAYKVALDQGLTKEQAASVGKNLTVNFNRKGQAAQVLGAFYGFFNASVQGTARTYETLSGPVGRKIIAGGLLLGTLQAIALALAGFNEDEPEDYIKDRNIVIPMPNGKYFLIPMPLGYHVIPAAGRILTESVLSKIRTNDSNVGKNAVKLLGVYADAFNPIGNSGLSPLTFSPTVTDPLVALWGNKDNFGKPIAKLDRDDRPSPGYSRSRETATWLGKNIAEFMNYASGGTEFRKGAVSPTGDQLDFLAGQVGGGAFREVSKAYKYAESKITGEQLPENRIPIAGRVYGDSKSDAAVASKFYKNVAELVDMGNEIKGLAKAGKDIERNKFMYYNPESQLFGAVVSVEEAINDMTKGMKEMKAQNMPKEQIEEIRKERIRLMKQMNDQIEALRESKAKLQ